MGENNDLVRLFRSGINHKIIFGTDWPIVSRTNMNRGLISMLASDEEKLYISTSDAQFVLSRNMERILDGVHIAPNNSNRTPDNTSCNITMDCSSLDN